MRVYALALVLAASLVFVPAAAAAPLVATCNGATDCASHGWYRTNVTVAFAWDMVGVTSTSGCDTQTLGSDTTGRNFDCIVSYGGGVSAEAKFTLQRDATPPTVTGASPSRGPDAGGWYNHPVGINFNGTDATSGLDHCNTTTYGGPDSAGASFSGTCVDRAGNTSGPASFGPIRYDATPPAVSVALSRGPDFGDWYNHPVGFSASGS